MPSAFLSRIVAVTIGLSAWSLGAVGVAKKIWSIDWSFAFSLKPSDVRLALVMLLIPDPSNTLGSHRSLDWIIAKFNSTKLLVSF